MLFSQTTTHYIRYSKLSNFLKTIEAFLVVGCYDFITKNNEEEEN